jgi:hypothetical protein
MLSAFAASRRVILVSCLSDASGAPFVTCGSHFAACSRDGREDRAVLAVRRSRWAAGSPSAPLERGSPIRDPRDAAAGAHAGRQQSSRKARAATPRRAAARTLVRTARHALALPVSTGATSNCEHQNDVRLRERSLGLQSSCSSAIEFGRSPQSGRRRSSRRKLLRALLQARCPSRETSRAVPSARNRPERRPPLWPVTAGLADRDRDVASRRPAFRRSAAKQRSGRRPLAAPAPAWPSPARSVPKLQSSRSRRGGCAMTSGHDGASACRAAKLRTQSQANHRQLRRWQPVRRLLRARARRVSHPT